MLLLLFGFLFFNILLLGALSQEGCHHVIACIWLLHFCISHVFSWCSFFSKFTISCFNLTILCLWRFLSFYLSLFWLNRSHLLFCDFFWFFNTFYNWYLFNNLLIFNNWSDNFFLLSRFKYITSILLFYCIWLSIKL